MFELGMRYIYRGRCCGRVYRFRRLCVSRRQGGGGRILRTVGRSCRASLTATCSADSARPSDERSVASKANRQNTAEASRGGSGARHGDPPSMHGGGCHARLREGGRLPRAIIRQGSRRCQNEFESNGQQKRGQSPAEDCPRYIYCPDPQAESPLVQRAGCHAQPRQSRSSILR